MRNIYILLGFVLLALLISTSGCSKHESDSEGAIDEDGYSTRKRPKLKNIEVERRTKDYFLDLDSVANVGELYEGIASGLDIDIVIEAENISPDTPINLEHSKESLVIQILEYITTGTRTRFEIRRGKLYIKDAR